ncbi:MAG: phosphoserine aminotransferase, partial [Pseudomonadota bacterium]|nr:phosphoserine aminotransferase [Pseudomonadota bacterium]
TKCGKLIEGIFKGETINTPSMLAVEDYVDALKWAEDIGGLPTLLQRSADNLAVLSDWVVLTDWVDFLCAEEAYRSNTSICLKIVDSDVIAMDEHAQAAFSKRIAALLDAEGAAYDIGAYRDAPPGLRIWGGATVETADLEILTKWLDWAFAKAKEEL